MHKRRPELPAGTRIGPLELIDCLGKGASAHVYRVRQESGVQVAMKIRSREGGDLDPRFLREFESLRRLKFPGVVDVYDAGQDKDWQWFTMEIVDGISLRDWIQEAPDTAQRVQRACTVGAQLFGTLSRVHANGLVHRDLKPSNILVDKNGSVRVLDFGVVGWWSAGIHLTSTGAAVGTLPYMAPEQMAGHRPTQAVDIFAAGICLYEGVAGERAKPTNPQGWVSKQILERLSPLACRDTAVSRAFSATMEDCLRLDPSSRPSAAQLARTLREITKGNGASRWPSAPLFVGREDELKRIRRTTRGDGPRLLVLRGEAGSGKRRLVEELARHALLEAQRMFLGHCRLDVLGGAVGTMLTQLLQAIPAREWTHPIPEADARVLLSMWPWLPLQFVAGSHKDKEITREDVIQSCVRILLSTIKDHRLILCFLDLEDIDSLSARVVRRLANSDAQRITLIGLLDQRWASARASDLVETLAECGLARTMNLQPLSPTDATKLAGSLLPSGRVPSFDEPSTPLEATAAGLRQLAAQRGEAYPEIEHHEVLLACARRSLPAEVVKHATGHLEDMVKKGLLHPLADNNYQISCDHLQRMAEAKLQRRTPAHVIWAEAWEAWISGGDRRWIGAAEHRIQADRHSMQAWEAAVRASLVLTMNGQFADARSWLMLLDTIPRDKSSEVYKSLRFALSWCQSRISLACDTERVRRDLYKQAASRAKTVRERARAAQLQVELLQREGKWRESVVKALRGAARIRGELPHLAVGLLLQSVHSRIQLDQASEGLNTCAQVEDILTTHPSPELEVWLEISQAQCLALQGQMALASQKTESIATKSDYHDLAGGWATSQLLRAETLLRLGHRIQAEERTRDAHERFRTQGDRQREVHALLLGAELSLGRGDLGAARLNAQEAASMAKKLCLSLQHARALDVQRIALAYSGEWEEVEQVRTQRDEVSALPDWCMLAETICWRIRERPERAQAACSNMVVGGWAATLARLELARAWLAVNEPIAARAAIETARESGIERGFSELLILGKLVEGVLTDEPDDSWDSLVDDCRKARWIELFLGVNEFDARRAIKLGRHERARLCTESLEIRADDLGHAAYSATARQLQQALIQTDR